MSSNILGTALRDKDHLAALDAMVEDRFNAIDLTPLLMYLLDVVPSVALPSLASQFDVLGLKGWNLTSNDDDRRSLIKRAIELHRYKGTPYAVKEALKSIGYYDVKIQEGMSFFYDATYNYDGTIVYGGGNWATFRIQLLDLGETKGISSEGIALIIQMVNEYKRESAHLLDILFNCSTFENEEIDEDLDTGLILNQVNDDFNITIYYDGTYNYDGSKLYTSETDKITLGVITNDPPDFFNHVNDDNLQINILYL